MSRQAISIVISTGLIKKAVNSSRWVALCCAASLAAAQPGFDEQLENALQLKDGTLGQIQFNLRYRYENFNEKDAPRKTANASSLRLQLGYLTPELHGLQGYVEMEANQDIVENDYNSTRNGKTQFSTIADPQIVELNQFWVGLNDIANTSLKVGRQVIEYDNSRFIGKRAWRQLEQTFDAITVNNSALPDLNIQLAFLWRVQDPVSQGATMTSPLINIAYSGLSFATLTAYGYWLDYDDAADSGQFAKSTQTYGVSFKGSQPVHPKVQMHYAAEYAYQADYGENPINYQADYLLFESGLTAYAITAKAGVEFLTSDNGVGMITPLARLHPFQGWADQFPTTPNDGLRDVYGSFSLQALDTQFIAVYHDFDDDTGAINYGEEIDFLIRKDFGKHYSLLLSYANYNAKAHATDVQRFWIQGSMHF